MIDPEPNVIPRIIWGAIKNLLVKGYNTIRRAKNKDIFIVKGFVNKRINIERKLNKKKNFQADLRVTAPLARGLPTVLFTNLSILKSLISLITHPQDLTSIDPIMTIRNSLKPIFELNPEISKPRSDGHNKR